ncbi:MAG: type II secretion system F family protein [Lachnospiraceae bacterium]|nr:type II secretion system F family protein [Lachnospiraceae bacterium]
MSEEFDVRESSLDIGDPAAALNFDKERFSDDSELTFIEPVVPPMPVEEVVEKKPKKKKRKGKKNALSGKALYQAEPKGDWSEFSSARVTSEDIPPVNMPPQLPAGDGPDKGPAARITDTYTVVEKTEFEKIDISREESRGTIPFKDLRDMCFQFHAISESGVSTIDTIRILMDQTTNDELREALENIYNDIKGGEDLSSAMSNCACFPFAFTIAVSAAEKNDMVALAFRRFGDIFAREDECREMEKVSVFYPVLTTVCSLVVMSVMMLVVYPSFARMFEGVGSELPGLSKAMLSMADSFKGMWWLITIIIALILLGIFIIRKASSADILGPKLGERSLPSGSYKRMNVYAKFARYMNVLLTVGVATKDALFVTAHSFTEYPFLTSRLLDAANASSAGSTLSNALCVFDFFPIMVLQMISVGEEMGDTPRMLMHVAEYYEEEARKEAARKRARKEPVSIVIMAVVVLFLLLSMLTPLLKFFDLVRTL